MQAAVYVGVDIGKTSHYAVAVDATGQTIRELTLANDEAALRNLVDWVKQRAGVVVVDQDGGLAGVLLLLCWQADVRIGYLHGLAMARAREFYAGESKTDPKDAFVLADVARVHPRRVAWLEPTSEALAQLELLCGYDADLRADANRLTNRLRALVASHWPALERAFGERLDSRGVVAVIGQYPSGPAIKAAGVEQVGAALKAQRVHRAEALAQQWYQAAMAQTVSLRGSAMAARLITELATQLAAVLRRREQLNKEIEQAFFDLPEARILCSLPGIGPRLGARIAVEIGCIRRFRTPAQLAAYAGLGPTPWQSGTSINRTTATRFGNHRLKNALFLAAFSSLRHGPSRTYYDRKRAQGRRHAQAVLCLARRRVDVLHAMLSQGVQYCAPAALVSIP
ncbi:MAG: IS110 family transposase [Chloroflexi bacterium]|nr:IS110 family transposase [Chloroflexota bacterium]